VITRRAYSVPERLALLGAACACAGTVYPAIIAHTGGRGLPCPMLAMSGIPCPFCGLTTAVVALSHGSWTAGVRASPLACLAAVLVAMTAPVLLARAAGLAEVPRPWPQAARRRTGLIISVIVALNWIYELHRFRLL
jgi:Protein of unknown function (DUF2752)